MQIALPVCTKCKHFNVEKWNCKAFKEGIPEVILTGEDLHSQPLEEQENNIVFEPLED